MKRILVSGASGIVGYGILRSLKLVGEAPYLIGTSIYSDSVAPAFCDRFELAPPTESPDYFEWLTSTLERQEVDMLIPGIEIDMYCWLDKLPELIATGATPLLNSTELIRLCADKWGFYQQLARADCAMSIESSLDNNFSNLRDKFGLPFLIKPRRGFGSKGVLRVDSNEQFKEYETKVGNELMAQPIVGTDDEEYTTSAFCDGSGGYFACMTLRRRLSRDGFTEKAEVVFDDSEFEEAVSTLCGLFLPLGPTNFQFRHTGNGLKLLEINPRISSSTSIRTAFGYNESEMALDYFLNRIQPTQPKLRQGKAIRYLEEAIFYQDSIHI